MDDVFVIVGLLLFGSLLFCLCCYKVSNLLYMLYHIDDSTDSEDNDNCDPANTALLAAAAAAINGAKEKNGYNFVNNYSAAAAAAASGSYSYEYILPSSYVQ